MRPALRALLIWALALGACLGWNAVRLVRDAGQYGVAYVRGWDDNFYYAWGRSLVFDGDLDFRNDFAFVASQEGLGPTAPLFRDFLHAPPQPTETGRPPNKFGAGMGFLAAPALLLSRGVGAGAEATLGVPAGPFSALHVFTFRAVAIVFGFLGLLFTWRMLAAVGFAREATGALALVFAGTPLGYYVWFEPTMAHAMGSGLCALFVLLAVRWRAALGGAADPGGGAAGGGGGATASGDGAKASGDGAAASGGGAKASGDGAAASGAGPLAWAAALGLCLGLAATVRYSNAVFALAPLALGLETLRRVPPEARGAGLRTGLASLAVAAAAFALGFLPQLAGWKAVYGSWLTDPYVGEGLYAWPRNLGAVLAGERFGLLVWSPLAAPALAGLVLAARGSASGSAPAAREPAPADPGRAPAADPGRMTTGDPGLAAAGGLVVAALLLLYGSWWEIGHSFGMRGLVEASPFLALGLAVLIERAAPHPRGRLLLGALLAACVAWSVFLLFAYRAEIIPHGAPPDWGVLFTSWDAWAERALNDTGVGLLFD